MGASENNAKETVTLRVSLEGSLGLRDVKKVHAQLNDAFAIASSIEIDAKELASADISIVQLLIAARKSASLSGQHLSLASEPAGSLRATFVSAGLLGADGVCRSPEESFWADAA